MSSSTDVLDVDTGKWKANNTFPHLLKERFNHSSCVVKDSVFVIGGETSNRLLSNIEMLEIKINVDRTFSFPKTTWTTIESYSRLLRMNPFVSAIGDNSLLLAGKYGGVIFDLNSENLDFKKRPLTTKSPDIGLRFSHGVLTLSGIAVGLSYCKKS